MLYGLSMTSPTGRGARSQQPEDIAARERLAAWAKAYSDAVVDGVLHYRDKRGIKNADLIARLERLGWPVTSNTLAGILGKKRSSMPATDVMLFAAALNVPPAALLFATHTNEEQRIAPSAGRTWKPYELVRWFAGALDLPVVEFEDQYVDLADDYYEVGDIVSRAEEIEQAVKAFDFEHARLVLAVQGGGDATVSLKRAQAALEALAQLRRYLRLFHPDAALPEVRSALAFVDQPKRQWPELPLNGYSTEREIEEARDAQRARPSSPDGVRQRLEADLDAMLEKGTDGGEA